ncbi:MAG TPA: AMP-binding protein [Solirubrobacteraceae bacterium]|jgi:acetyl-CoA synthetase|nr:AMP-binding protein [Solirubrobacteraceae bacterium]
MIGTTSYEQAVADFSWEQLWSLFDGDREHLNIAHECLDRHPPDRVAARIAHADGAREHLSFGELSCATSQCAHLLEDIGIAAGDRVAVMMQPSAGFYTSLFGAIKRGAVAVPLYTLFGPDAVRDRMDDCEAACLIVDAETAPALRDSPYRVLQFETDVAPLLGAYRERYAPQTTSRDLAVLQYTSGTSRQLPEAVRHDHRAIVTLARAGLFALGLHESDRYFCPSSPAWGHGLWHGTIAPWSIGVALGSFSGRFAIEPLIDALVDLRITNLAAASTIYRMILRSGRLGELTALTKASYTGEELDPWAQQDFLEATGTSVRGMYGTTETGVVLGNYPGFSDYEPRIGALGKPLPGCELVVLDAEGNEVAANVTGELAVKRRGQWFRSKDLSRIDGDGYFWYAGRADDVIIASGWTISPVEVERTLLQHADVVEAAVIGVPDELRGAIVKAVLVANRNDEELVAELQRMVRGQLSPHEYPREIEFVDALPKTANGKVNRRALRDVQQAG